MSGVTTLVLYRFVIDVIKIIYVRILRPNYLATKQRIINDTLKPELEYPSEISRNAFTLHVLSIQKYYDEDTILL